MPRTSTSPRFTEANKLFMYRLLRDQLGCGKQTFITRVDEVLAQDRLTAEDLGFDSTLQLLEALGADVVKITLFKGGRAYATVLPREDWDKALAAPEIKTPAKGNKPWKKKKGDKSIKPSCPKRVKRDEAPSDSPAAMTDEDDATALPDRNAAEGSASASDFAPSNAATADSTPTAPQKAATRDPRLRNANFSLEGVEADQADTAKDEDEDEADDTAAEANASESEAAPGGNNAAQDAEERAADSPRIALTVTYDPYTGQQGESSLVATPEELAKRAAEKPPHRPPAAPRKKLPPPQHAPRRSPASAAPPLSPPPSRSAPRKRKPRRHGNSPKRKPAPAQRRKRTWPPWRTPSTKTIPRKTRLPQAKSPFWSRRPTMPPTLRSLTRRPPTRRQRETPPCPRRKREQIPPRQRQSPSHPPPTPRPRLHLHPHR